MAGDNLLNNLPQEEALQLLDQKKPGIKVRDNLEILEKSAEETGIAALNCKNPGIKLQRMCSGVVFVAPDFYRYTQDAVRAYDNNETVAGIALYRNDVNGYVGLPFYPFNDGSDAFFRRKFLFLFGNNTAGTDCRQPRRGRDAGDASACAGGGTSCLVASLDKRHLWSF